MNDRVRVYRKRTLYLAVAIGAAWSAGWIALDTQSHMTGVVVFVTCLVGYIYVWGARSVE
jgi:hypothetical protein